MKHLTRTASAIGLFVLLALVVCSSGDSEPSQGTFVEALEWVPSNRDNAGEVFLFNLANLRETAGVELPED